MTIDKTMSIGEVLRLDMGTARIMMEYGMHCLGCAAHGSDVTELVSRLNAYFAEKA